MGSINLYIPGRNHLARALLSDLNAIAAKFGYVSRTGDGALSHLIVGMAEREVLLVRNTPELVLGLKAFISEYPDQEWAKKLMTEIS